MTTSTTTTSRPRKYQVNKNFFNTEQLRFVMVMYEKGGPDKTKAEMAMIAQLEGYITSLIYKNFRTYARNHLDDLKQEGFLAVLENMERYDPDRARPTTFFKNYIISKLSTHVTEVLHQNTPHYRDAETKIKRYIQEYSARTNGEIPTDDQIIESTGVSPQTLKVIAEQKMATKHIFLDSEERPDYADTSQPTPEERLLENERVEELYRSLNKLDSLTKQIICMKYGLVPYEEEHTNNQIYQATGVSPDKITIAINKGFQKIRRSNPTYARKSEQMIDDLMKLNTVPSISVRYDDSFLEKDPNLDGPYLEGPLGQEEEVFYLEELPAAFSEEGTIFF